MIYTVYCLCALKLGFHLAAACHGSMGISHSIEFQIAPAFHSSPRSPRQNKKGMKRFPYQLREVKQTGEKHHSLNSCSMMLNLEKRAEGVCGR